MAHFMHEGQKIELAEDWRIGELIRAENALDLDMETARTGGKTALVVYISMARITGWKPGDLGNRGLADLVMRMEFAELGDEEESDPSPLDDGSDHQGNGGREKDSASDDPKTSGHPLSVPSE